ncbi:MAG: hypothetical protein HC888_07680 [Candidatus Competibacteraceae bacterium]|nr:hypothetical protein [Candidatus Competibacteraceae bacterium]
MRSPLLRLLHHYGGRCFGLVSLLVLLAAMAIFAQDSTWVSTCAPPLFPHCLYHALRLFTANLPDEPMRDPNDPVLISIAVLAILLTLVALAQLAGSLITRVVTHLQRRARRNHVILCGLGQKATHLAQTYRRGCQLSW